MKKLLLMMVMLTSLFSEFALTAEGLLVESVKRPQNDYGKWIIHLSDSGSKYECLLKNLSKNGSRWVLECPEGNYRITRPFNDRFAITKEGEKSGYMNKAGYFIHTQLHEIRLANKGKFNTWLIQGRSSVLTATFSDMKEWKAHFFNLNGAKEGEMVLSWPFSDLKEIAVKDGFAATTEEQKRHKFLVIFATIFSSVSPRR